METFTIINGERVRAAVNPAVARRAVRDALVALSRGHVVAPPEIGMVMPHGGELHIKGAHVSPSDFIAFKVATGGFPNGANSGGTLVVDARSGKPLSFIVDGGWLTEMRTAAAAAVASQALARKGACRIAIIGNGTQAPFQIAAHREAFSNAEIRVWGRDPAKTRQLVGSTSAEPTETIEAALAHADVVVTVTSAHEPVVQAHLIEPGTHITAVGADMVGKQELDPEIVRKAGLVVADDPQLAARVGELQHHPAIAAKAAALGDILDGSAPGRPSDHAVTVCDLCGLGVEDAAMAELVM